MSSTSQGLLIHQGFWYLPGILYDLAFCGIFQGLRRHVARTVEKEGSYP